MPPITETRPQDILCGKEKHCVSHQGSLDFRVVIDQYAAKYAEAITKQEKMNVTKEIYDMLGAKNARFLKMNQKTKNWEELSSLLARDKISHALRFANREKKTSIGASTTASKAKASRRGHRRTGSDDSNSTLTTVATELSFEEFENLMMDDEPLEWEAAAESTISDSNSSSEPRPYVYEVPAHYHHGPPPPPYYHPHAYAPRSYYYPHPHSPPYHPSAHYPPQHHHHPYPPAPQQQEPEEPMAFPEKPLPAPPARESSMDVDLTYMMSEPLMEWELDTEEVLFVR